MCYEQRFYDQRVIVPQYVIPGSREKCSAAEEYRERIHDSQRSGNGGLGEKPEIVRKNLPEVDDQDRAVCPGFPSPILKELSSKAVTKRVSPFYVLKKNFDFREYFLILTI